MSRIVGHENLQKPEIKRAIEVHEAQVVKRSGINGQYVLDQLVLLLQRCTARGRAFAPAASARCLELIGRHAAVNCFARSEELHIHVEALSGRTQAARIRLLEKPNAPVPDEPCDDDDPEAKVN